jgi:MraZ protein
MFLGEYQHTLDAKGRVILPVKFRDELQGGGVIGKTRDRAIAVYPTDEWEAVAREVQEIAKRGPTERQAARSFFAGATEVEPDKQGRVPVPPQLREYAALDRDVVVVGVFNRIEIWDAATWREKNAEGEQALATEAALADFGI